jgi:hypothetical protein
MVATRIRHGQRPRLATHATIVGVADTGFASQDAQSDFSRARRGAALNRLTSRLRGQAGDVSVLLPLEEVIAALGKVGERYIGLETIHLNSVVGTVDRSDEFDRDFRPRSPRVRQRWQRINEAQRRGTGMPPIKVFRIGDMHFVEDGHHRVSVACYLRLDVIEAYVTQIITRVDPGEGLELSQLPAKGHERLFHERVPLPKSARDRIVLTHPEVGYGELAEAVEAWGFRLMQALERPMDRHEIAEAWWYDEYVPVTEMIEETGLRGSCTETDAYLRISRLRYELLRTHKWSDEVIEQLRELLA